MIYAMVECAISCPKCDGPVPLNGPWEAAHCDRCQTDTPVPHDFWKGVFDDILEEIRSGELKEGEGRNSTQFGMFRTTLLYGCLKARCEKCKTGIEVDENLAAPYVHACPGCGLKTDVAPSPPWLRQVVPPARVLVAAQMLSGGDVGKSAAIGPVIFTCPQCGGALKVDGSDRLIPCTFCGASVYLPDDLWLRLHPAKTKARWFVGFGKLV